MSYGTPNRYFCCSSFQSSKVTYSIRSCLFLYNRQVREKCYYFFLFIEEFKHTNLSLLSCNKSFSNINDKLGFNTRLTTYTKQDKTKLLREKNLRKGEMFVNLISRGKNVRPFSYKYFKIIIFFRIKCHYI